MDSEYRQLAERLEQKETLTVGAFNFVKGNLGPNELVLTQSGIGKVNAALCALVLIEQFAPQCVLNTGVAGGIDRSLRVTDVVAGARVAYHDVWCGMGNEYGQVQGLPAFFEGSAFLLRHALSLNKNPEMESRVLGGLICTGDQFIEDRAQLDKIKQHFPQGLAVDMESAAMAQTCYLFGVPFLSFRVISDTPGAHEDNFSQYCEFWGTLAKRSYQTIWMFLSTMPDRME